jgi:ectoine hydroxylase-related dioxygenase (phytanoyl-CoA dioxygenase family)
MTNSLLRHASGATRGWLTKADCKLDDFVAVVSEQADLAEYPHAAEVVHNVVVYECGTLSNVTSSAEGRRRVQAELARVLLDGPGIVVLKGAFSDLEVVDRATNVFQAIIDEQKASQAVAGDHFAKPGANDRIWNALEKLAVRDPEVFARYYANDVLDLVSVAWLGPAYQVTSQVNVVNPGGAAQSAHRDYHLGFMSEQQAAAFPAHVHQLTPSLTLQGAVAHSDMPLETGPTLYLPYSHKYESGYLAFHRPEFAAYFDDHYVQLPLSKGDAAFFNPAVFHGAGHNRSADVRRMANLLQVSSAFGRAMESVDRRRMSESLYPALLALRAEGMDEAAVRNVVAVTAEGYGFPTNLDQDQPVDGLAPETQAELLWRAVESGWTTDEFAVELRGYDKRRTSNG